MPSACCKKPTCWQWLGTIEYADVIEPEEPAGEKIVSLGIFAIHPPGEIQHQLLERAFQEREVALTARPGHFVNTPDGPCVHRWIHIAKSEFVSRDLSVRMHVPFAQEKIELLLCEMRIDL